jgi:FKBP12-rapamycin complex-associated protein
MQFRESKERLIRRAVVNLLPRLARFSPERFAGTYLPTATQHLIGILRNPAERGVGALLISGLLCSLGKTSDILAGTLAGASERESC